MIHVIATVEVTPGARTQFLDEFRHLVPTVRAERGCLEYGPAVEIAFEHPAAQRPRDNVVVIVERWATPADLEAHLAAPHMTEYRGRVKDLVISTRLQVLEAVE